MNKQSLILLRGLPGSGKSTFARLISEEGRYPVFCVDDYFTNSETGEYVFEFQNNHKAYADCVTNTRAAIEKGALKVIVENTFVFDWEMEPYFALAKEFKVNLFVLTTEKYHIFDNVHAITDEQILKMAERYKVKLC